MNTRKGFIRDGFGLAAILSAQSAPALLVRSMVAARGSFLGRGAGGGGGVSPLCFTASAPSSTVALAKYGSPEPVSLIYSTNGSDWNVFEAGNTVVHLDNVGDRVYLKGGSGGNRAFAKVISNNVTDNWEFALTGSIAASGNVNSLLDGQNEVDELGEAAFSYLFETNSALMSAPELPSSVLGPLCYAGMFSGCTNLTDAPFLPASEVKRSSYASMFSGCTNLSHVSVGLVEWANLINGTNQWLSNVKGSGVFECPSVLGTSATIARGSSYCPTRWTVINI